MSVSGTNTPPYGPKWPVASGRHAAGETLLLGAAAVVIDRMVGGRAVSSNGWLPARAASLLSVLQRRGFGGACRDPRVRRGLAISKRHRGEPFLSHRSITGTSSMSPSSPAAS